MVTPKKHPLKMLSRLACLFFIKPDNSGKLLRKSYDRISIGYDQAWTNHMRNLTESLIDRLTINQHDKAIDLTCGTGFATNLIARKTNTTVIGIDQSEGMLQQAQKMYSPSCNFINADILEYLRTIPDNSLDLITCCWGLGYSKPFAVLKQIKRTLKPQGKVAIIDNTIFSIREVLYCSFLTFMEQPETLINLMKFRFLTGRRHLAMLFRMSNLKPLYLTGGSKSYTVESGQKAIEQLRATGAAAGFEYAANPDDQQRIFKRFAEIIEQKYMKQNAIKITHRYLAGIAEKCSWH